LFLPQTPYMLLGTLREQLIYPNLRENITDQEIKEALTVVNLEDLGDRMGGLDAEKDWAAVLSQGEQQRLAFARILLSQPKYVILDEATSALDVPNERRLYDLLQSLDITYISVGHRPSLVDYHQTVLELGVEKGWQLQSAENYRFAT
jgi:vitamin B12/bleomycin/antimicrobial peptide transport system ATP-binding/permease protein